MFLTASASVSWMSVSSSDVSPVRAMSLAQRVLLTWVFTLVFLIMLVLKMDGKVHVFLSSPQYV